MANRAGIDLLIYVEDTEGSDTFSVLGGQNSSTFTLNNELIETTDKLGNEFTEFLEGHGIQNLSVSGSGLADNTVTEERVRFAAFNRVGINMILVLTAQGPLQGKRITGRWMISSWEVSGEHTDAQNYSTSFESNGVVNYSN